MRVAAAVLLAMAVPPACGVSDVGLRAPPDAGSGGAGGIAVCFVGLTDQAGWPAKSADTACVKPCGPDELGWASCSQTDISTCRAGSGCVCLESPCVTCAPCTFLDLSLCYAPANAEAPLFCADGVKRGDTCSPACGHTLCLQKDGKSGCVCNERGKYACADWGDSGWK